MEGETNQISNEKLEEGIIVNTLPDYKNTNTTDGVKENPIKDTIGYWTDKQITENPTSYLEYLQSKLEKEIDVEKVKEIILEMESIKNMYLPDDYSKGRTR